MTYRRSICPVAAITIFLLQCFAYRAALATEPQRVLLIYNSVGYAEVVTRNIRAELQLQSPNLIETYFAPIAAARASDQSVSGRHADYLGSLFPDQRLELAVAVGSPGMNFFREYGRHIFPSTPLLAIVEESRAPSNPERNETIVTSHLDMAGAIENILQLLPETTSVSVVIGNSPLEQYWLAKERLAFQPFASRISFRWLNDLSFDELLKYAATLPPRSAILFNSLFSDALGGAYDDHQVVSKLHAVATAPIFTFDVSDFGEGIVGGPWPSTQEVSRNYASVALRILGGEALGGLKIPGIVNGPPKFDWREMQRWGISESRLPPGSEVDFRELTVWEQYRAQILAICAALLAQAALIGWLIYEQRRRRLAEIVARNSMAELAHMDRIATAGELSASIAHEVNQPLTGIVLRATAALRWLSADTPDIGKAQDALSQIVRAGHRVSDIVKGLRAMFTKETGTKTSIEINDLIRTVLEITRIDREKVGVELQNELDDTVPLVVGDKVQLQQVVVNLVMNAIESMQTVQPRVLKVRSECDKPSMVKISIEDTGTGVDPANLDRLFKPLFTTKARGMGMGLSICRSIIDSHDGRIWVSSGVERGSIFQFQLPAKTPVRLNETPREALPTRRIDLLGPQPRCGKLADH